MTALRDLFPDLARREPQLAGLSVSGLTADSRQVRPGALFFAIAGTRADGLAYVQDAIARGAAAVIAERAPDTDSLAAPVALVADARAAFAQAAAAFYPRQPEIVVAVTGTSGKTSVAAFVRQIWMTLGVPAAAIGTTGVVAPSGVQYGSLTTPDPVALHQTLDALAGEGVKRVAMEASSHGLDQRRLDGVRLAAGAFTNLSRDHLDYHHDLESYLNAKLRLFDTLLPPDRPAVVNIDNEAGLKVAEVCRARGLRTFTVGRNGEDLKLAGLTSGPAGAALVLERAGRRFDVALPLAGDFMASNALVAAGLCLALGDDQAAVFAALECLQGAPGRLEKAGERRGAPIFVDYAHKPDALEQVLRALRPLAARRLVVVFGCGGDRDRGKRAIMGAIAAREADRVIVTDDNPRSENPDAIRAEILSAAPNAIEIGDRAAAIAAAVAELDRGDVLVVAGKGHETGQIIGDRVLPFSDRDAVLDALKAAGS